jgi:hypothetical protein
MYWQAVVNSRPPLDTELDEILVINGRYFQECRFSLRFNMLIPDPKGQRTEGFTVQGLLLYFPCANGTESRPSSRLRKWDEDDNNVENLCDGDDEEEEGRGATTQEPVFRCYWQNRLVPETEVEKLNFFPDAAAIKKCDVSHMPPPPAYHCALPHVDRSQWRGEAALRDSSSSVGVSTIFPTTNSRFL